jgi:hypothetical protein
MTLRALSRRLLTVAVAVSLTFSGAALRAQDPKSDQQDEGPSPAELAKQIRRNMLKIEEDLQKAGTHDPARGEQVKKDFDKLLEGMKGRQDQVVKDIDEIVKSIKTSNSSSGSSGSSDSNQNQKQSKSRDRNQSDQKSGKPRDPNGGKPKDGKPKQKDAQKPGNKKGSGAEDNGKKEPDPGENTPGDPRESPKAEKFARINLNEIWGNLPPELRQKLIDRNFDDFTPEYKAQIEEYFKKTSSLKKE